MPPRNEPTPNAASTRPHGPAPPRSRSAITGPSTIIALNRQLPRAAETTVAQTQVRLANSCQPSRSSDRNDAPAARAWGGSRRAARQRALSANEPASAAIAQPAPTVATRMPAMAGPTISPPAWASPRSALACWRRPVLTVSGTSPVVAGLKTAVAAPCTPCSTTICQIWASPVRSSTASRPCAPSRARSAAIIAWRRDTRSATTPPTSRSATSGTQRAASTRPRSVAEPVTSSTAKARATGTMPSPTNDDACAVKNSLNSRSESASRALGRLIPAASHRPPARLPQGRPQLAGARGS